MIIPRRLVAVVLLAVFALGVTAPTIAFACEGGGGGTLEAVDKPLDFGKVPLKTSKTLTDIFKVKIGTVHITKVASDNTKYVIGIDGCTNATLTVGKSPETCSVEMTFTPLFEPTEAGHVNVNEGATPLENQELTGSGENIVTLGSLSWAHGTTGTKKSPFSSLQNVKILKMTTTNMTDFKLPETAGCKTGAKKVTACEVEVTRQTTTLDSASLSVEYEDEETNATATKTAALKGD